MPLAYSIMHGERRSMCMCMPAVRMGAVSMCEYSMRMVLLLLIHGQGEYVHTVPYSGNSHSGGWSQPS